MLHLDFFLFFPFSVGDFSFDAILPHAGYTAVFAVPKAGNSDTSVAFTFDEGTCELQVLCKNGQCKVSNNVGGV